MILKKLFLTAFILGFGYAVSYAQHFNWVRALEGSVQNSKVLTDKSGNIYTAGYFSGNLDADPGPGVFTLTADGIDIFLIKTNAMGNLIWAKKYGGSINTQTCESICIDDSANVFLAGYFGKTMSFVINGSPQVLSTAGDFDAFVAKLDSSGNAMWASGFGQAGGHGGGASDIAHSISLDQSGNVYVAGSFWNIVDFDPGPGTTDLGTLGAQSAVVLKMSNSGALLWAKHFVGNANIYGFNVITDNSANVFVGGMYNDSADFDPGVGTQFLVSPNGTTSFVCKLDANGDFVWVKPFTLYSHSILVSNGNLFVSGAGQVHQLDNQGNTLWTKTIAPFVGLRSDKHGDLYSFGVFKGTIDFDPGPGATTMTSNDSNDIFIQKMDHSGNFIWAIRIGAHAGSSADQYIFDLAVDENLNLFATGRFIGDPDFDPGTDSSYLHTDSSNPKTFILRLDSAQLPMSVRFDSRDYPTITAYPNPTTGMIYFRMDEVEASMHVRVMNTAGQVVMKSVLNKGQQLSLDLSSLPAGMYWVELQNDQIHTRAKVLRR